jgi:tetratricopeptide (TPR) repeat protein
MIKKLLPFFILCFLAVSSGAQNINMQDGGALDNALMSNKLPQTLSTVFEEERPSAYQKEQILNTVNKLVQAAKNKKFTNYPQLVLFMAAQLPEPDDRPYGSILLKDAFPEAKGAVPKGTLDCDATSMLILSAIEVLNYPFGRNIYMAVTNRTVTVSNEAADELFGKGMFDRQEKTAHAELFDGKNYIDPMLNAIRKLNEEETLTVNVLNTQDKVRSLVLSSVGADEALKAQGNILIGRKENKTAMDAAVKKLQKAVELNPKNITALENLYTFTKNSDYKVMVAAAMIANYHDIYSVKTFNLLPREVPLPRSGNNTDPNIEALKKSEPIYKYVWALQGDLYYNEKYAESVKTGQLLLAADSSDRAGFINGYMALAYFSLKDYDNALASATAAIKKRAAKDYPQEAADSFEYIFADLYEYEIVLGIIEGKIILTDDNIEIYAAKSAVVNQILDGKPISMKYIDIADLLKYWEGCAAMVSRLGPQAKGAKTFCGEGEN